MREKERERMSSNNLTIPYFPFPLSDPGSTDDFQEIF